MGRSPIQLNSGNSSNSHYFFNNQNTNSRVILRNNRIDIVEPTEEELQALSKVLTVYDDYAKYPCPLWRGMIIGNRHEGKYTVSIPRFLAKAKITEIFGRENTPVYITDSTSAKRVDVNVEAEPRSDLQRRALNYLFPNNSRYFDYSIKVLDLPVGEGKTFLAIKAMAKMGVKANIFVHKITMIDTPWKKDLLSFTDIKEDEIGIIEGADSIEKILKNPDKYKVFITVHRTFSTMANKPNFFEYITEVYEKLGIGMNIIDEAHLEMLSCFMISMYTRTKFTLYLTATLGKTDRSEQKMFYKLVPVFASFSSNNMVTVNRFITYIPRPYKTIVNGTWHKKFENEKGVKLATYSEYVASNDYSYSELRKGIFRAIREVFDENSSDKHVAVILGTLNLIERLIADTKEEFSDLTVGNFTGMIPPKKRIEELKSNIIFSTEKGLNSAIDTTIDGMILCTSNTSDILLTQLIGRIRMKDPNAEYPVYDIFDTGDPKLADNFSHRKRTIIRQLAKNTRE